MRRIPLSATLLAALSAVCLPAWAAPSAPAGSAPTAPAHRAEVWIGGSRAWPDLISTKGRDRWRFLQANVDGFYINNFAMRHKGAVEAVGKRRDLEAVRDLLAHKDVFYETDRIHDSDTFDRESLDLFRDAKLNWVASTINYGTDATRTATLTTGGTRPLYYMFGPWHGGGDIARPENDVLRANILAASGGAVDGPVTQWRKNAGGMHTMCYTAIRWCHANGKKFLYLLAPNESGEDFLAESQKLVHGMEDNDANPDIWAISFYGPQVFRDKLETLPESSADGRPAETFCGAAYWLLHHLRDPDHEAKLAFSSQSNLEMRPDGAAIRLTGERTEQSFTLSNHSVWLDLAPVIRARVIGDTLPEGWHIRWFCGSEDVSDAVSGNGLAFTRDHRLEPGGSETLRVVIERPTAQNIEAPLRARLRIELLPHPSETIPEETLTLDAFIH